MVDYSLGHIDRIHLFEFSIRDNAKDIAKALREAGFKATAITVKKNIDETGVHILNNLMAYAEAATYSRIPFDTGYLWETNIETHIEKATIENPHTSMYIPADPHYSEDGGVQEASALANLLDSKYFNNLAHGGTTRNWIADVQLDFQNLYPRAIREVIK